jgi:hypothetical protein
VTVYALLRGERYATDRLVDIYATLDGATAAATAIMEADGGDVWQENDPPATDTVKSWLDADGEYLCVVEKELL